MKTLIPPHFFRTALLLGLAAGLAGGCSRQGPASGKAFKSSKHTPPVAAQTNSFAEVAEFLDPGGSFYLYLDTRQWLTGLSTRIQDFRRLLTAMPNMKPQDRANLDKAFDIASGLVSASGVEQVSGVGASGILVQEGMYQNRFILHHYPEQAQGLLWSAFGKEPHALTGLKLLPDTTAFATFSDLDASTLWQALRRQIEAAGLAEATQGLDQLSRKLEKQFGLSLDQAIDTLDGEVGLVLTLDDNNLVTLPQPRGGRLEFPEPGLAVVLKVKDDRVYQTLRPLLEKNPQVIKTDESDLQMRTLPLPFPFPVRPTLAYRAPYLFLASNDKLVKAMLASGNRLEDNDEFQQIAEGIPRQGNRFTYVSPEISRTVNHLINSAAFMEQAKTGGSGGGAELLQRLMGEDREGFSFSVASNTREGWVILGHSSRHPALALMGPTLVVPAAMAAAMAMPAMAKAKSRARSVNCLNNLKQIALAARMYANEHGEVMPSDFKSMKPFLNSPSVLVCPGDKSKPRPKSWEGFDFADTTYQIVAPGAKTADPQKVYARCPIHNNVCRMDGSAQREMPGKK